MGLRCLAGLSFEAFQGSLISHEVWGPCETMGVQRTFEAWTMPVASECRSFGGLRACRCGMPFMRLSGLPRVIEWSLVAPTSWNRLIR